MGWLRLGLPALYTPSATRDFPATLRSMSCPQEAQLHGLYQQRPSQWLLAGSSPQSLAEVKALPPSCLLTGLPPSNPVPPACQPSRLACEQHWAMLVSYTRPCL